MHLDWQVQRSARCRIIEGFWVGIVVNVMEEGHRASSKDNEPSMNDFQKEQSEFF